MNVIQWMYKNEQVQTTRSKIIQWLSVLLLARTYLLSRSKNLSITIN